MPLNYADRVLETTTTVGTGSYSLAGAATGYRGFVAGIGNGNTCYYVVTNGTDWETGLGTVTDGTPDTLSRDTIISSSNGGSAVSWGAGSKQVFNSIPASILSGALTKLGDIEPEAQVNPDGNEILAMLLAVDGSGSGLDADKLHGLEPTAFIQTANRKLVYLSSDSVKSDAGVVALTSLDLGTLGAGQVWEVEYSIFFTASGGAGTAIDMLSSGGTFTNSQIGLILCGASSTVKSRISGASLTGSLSTTADASGHIVGKGTVLVSTTTTLRIRFQRAAASGTTTVQALSSASARRIL